MSSNIKSKAMYQGLDKQSVYITDKSNLSPDYFVISEFPSQFNVGKNTFKIFGNIENLLPNSEVKIELLDAEGKPIYLEYNNDTDRLGRKTISAYVYSDNAFGFGTLTIIGVATRFNGILVPHEWQNKYNVKWQKNIKIDSLEKNVTPIVFDESPNISMTELFRQYIRYGTLIESDDITGITFDIKPNINQYSLNDSDYLTEYNSLPTKYGNITGSLFNPYNISEIKKISTDTNDFINNDTYHNEIYAPGGFSIYDLNKDIHISGTSILSSYDSLGKIDSNIIGGIIIIPEINQTIVAPDGYQWYKSAESESYDYVATIKRKIDDKHLEIYPPFIRKVVPISFPPTDINHSIDYVIPLLTGTRICYTGSNLFPTPTYLSAYSNIARFHISDIKPKSGTVYKIRTYVSAKGDFDNEKLISENVLEPYQLLIDTGSTLQYSAGDIRSTVLLRTYWSASVHGVTQSQFPVVYRSTPLLDSMRIGKPELDGNIMVYPVAANPNYLTTPSTKSQLNFDGNNTYEIVMNLMYSGSLSSKIDNSEFEKSAFKIYMSGSSFDSDEDVYDNAGTLIFSGKKIAEINLNSLTKFKDYNRISFKFNSDRDGVGTPIFYTDIGYWYLSKIELNSLIEPGYSPTSVMLDIPIEPKIDGDLLNFKFEFLDFKGNVADQYFYYKNVLIQSGSATYIQGNHNYMSGSLIATGSIYLSGSIDIHGSIAVGWKTVTNNYTYTISDTNIYADGNLTVTLPTNLVNGHIGLIKNVNSGSVYLSSSLLIDNEYSHKIFPYEIFAFQNLDSKIYLI